MMKNTWLYFVPLTVDVRDSLRLYPWVVYTQRVVTVLVNGDVSQSSFPMVVIQRKAPYMIVGYSQRERLSFFVVIHR